ncbi:MAG: membrane protein [Porticoccaceae bacterium]|nr:MAG: membrane protein [Porticoccaceae bacterium]
MNQPSSAVQFLLASASFVVVVAGLKAAQPMVVPFLVAVFIALICSPPLLWLKGKGVPGWAAVSLLLLAILAAGTLVAVVAGSSIDDFRRDLPDYQRRLLALFQQSLAALRSRGLELDPRAVQEAFNPGLAMQLAGATLTSLGNLMADALLILLTVAFILAEEVGLARKLAVLRGDSDPLVAALQGFAASVNRYLALKTLTSLLTGVALYLWLALLGVDYAGLWGLLAFLLNFIPTVGSILAAIPPVLLALVQLGPWPALWTGLGYLAVNMVVGNLLEPRLMGRGLDLSPLVVFLSLVFWGWVLGPMGMLLSVPLTILLKLALEQHPQTRWLGVLLGGRLPDPPPAREGDPAIGGGS